MPTQTVLVLGGTGRTGRRVVADLLSRDFAVRAIARSPAKLSDELRAHPNLTVIEANLLALRDDELRRDLEGCAAVVSCLGHALDVRGIFGAPRDLVVQAVSRATRQIEALAPKVPVKLVLMSSVSVFRPGSEDARRGRLEKAYAGLVRGVLPPARDNQRAADFLVETIGVDNPYIEWVAVRPDSLLQGEPCEYEVHDGLVDSLFSPGHTNIANVAHFMGELVANPTTWARWKGKLPVIVNRVAPGRETRRAS
jgi:NAD(P)-dependent dehydrogenase (short-subunit alcohol dehydrogenase family)